MKQILLVDDNADNRENFAEILEMGGYNVKTAGNGEQALNLLADELPDLILCDVQMPGMSGFELRERVSELDKQKNKKAVPFIFLSACSEKPELQLAESLGVSAYLVKPIEPRLVIEAIKNFI